MEGLKDSEEPVEDYWNDCEDSEEPRRGNFLSKKLVNGISIKDLCDGKDIMFEISKDNYVEDASEEDEEIPEDILQNDLKTMREKRGAPPLTASFREISDKMTSVTENGFVKKQIVTSGAGKTVPDKSYVTVHYNLYKENCELPFDSTYLRNHPEKFRLDQGEAIIGLEYAIKSMKKNENSMFFIKWEFAFGALGCPDRIGQKCDIVADITLINFVEIDAVYDLSSTSDISKMDFTKFLGKAKQASCNGSDEFSKGDIKAAIGSYRKALKILDSLRLADKNEEDQMLKQKVKCLVNLAVCYNKLGRSEQACLVCQEALSIDQNNVKANFHYGRANVALSNFAAAKRWLLKANKLKPNDKEINKELKKLNDKKALYDMKDKMFWTKAFEEKEKVEETNEELSPALKSFKESLMMSLEECLKEQKSHMVSAPLSDGEMKICEKVASQMKMKVEMHPHFYVFKTL